MIHQILTDTGQVNQSLDAELFQLGLGTNTRAIQDIGTAVGTTAHNDLFGCFDVDGGSVGLDCTDASSLKLPVDVLDDNLVNVCLSY